MIAASSVLRSGITPVRIASRCIGIASASRSSSRIPTLPVQGFDSQKMSHGTFMPAMSLPILSLRQPMPSSQTT